jgi:hypothetical protein
MGGEEGMVTRAEAYHHALVVAGEGRGRQEGGQEVGCIISLFVCDSTILVVGACVVAGRTCFVAGRPVNVGRIVSQKACCWLRKHSPA